MKRKED